MTFSRLRGHGSLHSPFSHYNRHLTFNCLFIETLSFILKLNKIKKKKIYLLINALKDTLVFVKSACVHDRMSFYCKIRLTIQFAKHVIEKSQ